MTKKKMMVVNVTRSCETQEVTVTCQPNPDCADMDLDNPSFNIGAHAGGLNSGGTSRGWNGIPESRKS
ncbi:MAG: hypothetical protein IPN60_19320 [Saprospiraceae bacterium]|nr:hypothetical protein [Candidatus Opimibacter skivensis]